MAVVWRSSKESKDGDIEITEWCWGEGGLRVDMSVVNLFYCSNEVSRFGYLTCLLINVTFSWKCVVDTYKVGHPLIGMFWYFTDYLEFHQSSLCRFIWQTGSKPALGWNCPVRQQQTSNPPPPPPSSSPTTAWPGLAKKVQRRFLQYANPIV